MAIEIFNDPVCNGYDADACKSSTIVLALVSRYDCAVFKDRIKCSADQDKTITRSGGYSIVGCDDIKV